MSHSHPAGAEPPGHPHHRDQHGNPADLDGYIARLEDPERAGWQKPDQVVAALGLRVGDSACDIGAGSGYFALRMARVVGDGGQVLAVDVEPRMLDVLRTRIVAAGVHNVTPVLALPDDALLPPASCDVILVVDTFHHLTDGPAYLRRLARALRKGGRLVNIDFHKRELPVGPPLEHKVAREDFLRQAETAGYRLVGEPTLLPYQYFLVLAPK